MNTATWVRHNTDIFLNAYKITMTWQEVSCLMRFPTQHEFAIEVSFFCSLSRFA